MAAFRREYANCENPLIGQGALPVGAATAWHLQCRACHALV